MGKIGVSAICAVALLLDEMEETQIHTAVKEAVDVQINEASIDTQKLIQDASHKVGDLIKQIEDKIALLLLQSFSSLHSRSVLGKETMQTNYQD